MAFDLYGGLGMDNINLGALGNKVLKAGMTGQNIGQTLADYMKETYGSGSGFIQGTGTPAQPYQDFSGMMLPAPVINSQPLTDIGMSEAQPMNQATPQKKDGSAIKSIAKLLLG